MCAVLRLPTIEGKQERIKERGNEMCTTYSFIVQEPKKGLGDITIPDKWVSVKELELPNESMPLCGCWLFDLDFGGEGWQKIEESYRLSGNTDKLPQTKTDAQKLNDMFRDRIFELLNGLTYDQRLIIERLA